MLYDKPTTGTSQYGEYFLYSVRNGDGATEYSYFAPSEVHEQLKALKKGDKATITKLAEQRGSKIVTKYDVQTQPISVKAVPTENTATGKDVYFESMLSSYEDALKIQERLNGMIDVNRVAITLYISKTKTSGLINGG